MIGIRKLRTKVFTDTPTGINRNVNALPGDSPRSVDTSNEHDHLRVLRRDRQPATEESAEVDSDLYRVPGTSVDFRGPPAWQSEATCFAVYPGIPQKQ
jgi:hypothetical protein